MDCNARLDKLTQTLSEMRELLLSQQYEIERQYLMIIDLQHRLHITNEMLYREKNPYPSIETLL